MAVHVPPGQIFVVGMNGSGTTMLRDHLASHSRIYGFPSETRSLPYFIKHEREFGDLGQEENFRRLWDKLTKSISKSAGPLLADVAMPEPAQRSVAGCFDHIMRSLAATQGKDIWCEKTPMYVHHMTLLGRAFPGARFIHVIRDGRACAASFHRRWRFNPVRTIVRWKQAVRDGMQQGKSLGGRYVEIRYEDLTNDPESTLRQLLAFLGLPFEPAVFVSSRSDADASTSHSASIVRNARSADEYFQRRVASRIEAVAGRLLRDLGYDVSIAGDADPPGWQLTCWRLLDDIRRFAMVSLTEGRILRPSNWRYIATRTRNALKQRQTSKW